MRLMKQNITLPTEINRLSLSADLPAIWNTDKTSKKKISQMTNNGENIVFSEANDKKLGI